MGLLKDALMGDKDTPAAPARVVSPEQGSSAAEDTFQSAMPASNDTARDSSPTSDGANKMATLSLQGDSSGEGLAAENEDLEVPEIEGDKGGLFGEGSEDEEEQEGAAKSRTFDDQELDSGDDEGRKDRAGDNAAADDDDDDDDYEMKDDAMRVMDVPMSKQATPRGADGQLYLLKMPPFLALEPDAFDPNTFEPPKNHHHTHANEAPGPTFSARTEALTTIRWRHSPEEPGQLQSNARILKWSDGSMTLQLASEPEEQFVLDVNEMAPPVHDEQGNRVPYDPKRDAHTYLVLASELAQMLRITNRVTGAITVTPSAVVDKEAFDRLKYSLAANQLAELKSAAAVQNMIVITEDPELAKRKAEQAERERQRQQKKIQSTMVREMERTSRLSQGGAGLSINRLETTQNHGVLSKRKKARRAKPSRSQATRSRYSDDEDDLPRYRSKEDEYDKTDGFLADSDEDEDAEFEEDDEDDDDLEMEEGSEEEPAEEEVEKKTKGKLDREKTSVKTVSAQKEDRDDNNKDAAADPEEASGPSARGKRRRVIVEDDEE